MSMSMVYTYLSYHLHWIVYEIHLCDSTLTITPFWPKPPTGFAQKKSQSTPPFTSVVDVEVSSCGLANRASFFPVRD